MNFYIWLNALSCGNSGDSGFLVTEYANDYLQLYG